MYKLQFINYPYLYISFTFVYNIYIMLYYNCDIYVWDDL
ncbi:hypothetical protein F383_31604 [Gossypium arboreum]|uniref:Uncharacterized protein n=1 Tax=Gossypium arboreum TaxID=29729 RepID=A0A0B0PIJ0_GOSAR|nr:hypothetical protein F383_31604 [Gossypium arboreum]